MHDFGFSYEMGSSKSYRCRITCEDRGKDFVHRSFTVPTLVEALARLFKFARQLVATNPQSGLDASREIASFSYRCQEYGYDSDSQKNRKRYVTIRRRAEQLKYVIGVAAHRALLTIVPSGEQGLGGLIKRFEEMQQEEFDVVADLREHPKVAILSEETSKTLSARRRCGDMAAEKMDARR